MSVGLLIQFSSIIFTHEDFYLLIFIFLEFSWENYIIEMDKYKLNSTLIWQPTQNAFQFPWIWLISTQMMGVEKKIERLHEYWYVSHQWNEFCYLHCKFYSFQVYFGKSLMNQWMEANIKQFSMQMNRVIVINWMKWWLHSKKYIEYFDNFIWNLTWVKHWAVSFEICHSNHFGLNKSE